MEIISREHSLMAILFLMTELNNRRFGTNDKNEIAQENVPEKERIINYVKKEKGLDFYNLDKRDLGNYEIILSDLITEVVNKTGSPSLDDEVDLLEHIVEIHPEEFNFSEFQITKEDKSIIKSQGITLPGINNWLEDPDYVHLYNQDDEHYLCTKKIKLNGDYKILFYHGLRKKFDVNKDKIELKCIMTFNFNEFLDMYSNPVRLFLFIIDNYGIRFPVNDQLKSFYLKIELTETAKEFQERIQKFMIDAIKSYPMKSNKGNNPIIYGFFINRDIFDNTKGYLSFSYILDYCKYLNDLKNKMI